MESLALDYVTRLKREFPDEYDLAAQATESVIAATAGQDFTALARHSPALAQCDWAGYLRLSEFRMVRALRVLRKRVQPGALVVDFGSYFGNFSVMAAAAGYRTIAFDTYDQYGACLEPARRLMQERGVQVVTSGAEGYFPRALEGADAIFLMGVIEHIPHTPRLLLEGLRGLLRKPNGLLILDTPNLAYLYKRLQLARGETVFAPIRDQYRTEIPYQGHHREYTPAEMEWMLETAGFRITDCDAFSYSIFGFSEISGGDLENYLAMETDPAFRELLLYAAVPDMDGESLPDRATIPTLVVPVAPLPEIASLRRELADTKERLDRAESENRRVKDVLRAIRHPIDTAMRRFRGR